MRTTILLASLILTSAMSGYGLAVFVGRTQSSTTDQKPVILGNFTMALNIVNVNDLYGWQTCIAFNATQLSVLDTKAGGFFPGSVTAQNLLFTKVGQNDTDLGEGKLLMCGFLLGPVPGVNGSGRLAVITFGRYTETYDEPELVSGFNVFDTMLLDSKMSKIPLGGWSLTLSVVQTTENFSS